jgi:hypothetical protein
MPSLIERVKVVLKLGEDHMSPADLVMMQHLLTHVVPQLMMYGPARELWMFCFEDYFGRMKRAVKTRSSPVASIMKNIELERLVNLCRGLSDLARGSRPPVYPLPEPPRVSMMLKSGVERQGKNTLLSEGM